MKYKSKSSVYNDRLYLVAKWLNETARQRCLKPNYLIRALYSEMIHPGWHVVVFCWNRLFPVTIEPPSPLQITESPQTEFLSAGGKCGELPLFLNIYRFLGFFGGGVGIFFVVWSYVTHFSHLAKRCKKIVFNEGNNKLFSILFSNVCSQRYWPATRVTSGIFTAYICWWTLAKTVQLIMLLCA